MLPTPRHVWLYTGTWPFSIFGVGEAQVTRRYPGFAGQPGGYPTYGVLIEHVGYCNVRGDLFRVSTYDADPRDALAYAARLPNVIPRDNCTNCKGERGGVLGNENVVDGRILCDYCTADLLPPKE